MEGVGNIVPRVMQQFESARQKRRKHYAMLRAAKRGNRKAQEQLAVLAVSRDPLNVRGPVAKRLWASFMARRNNYIVQADDSVRPPCLGRVDD